VKPRDVTDKRLGGKPAKRVDILSLVDEDGKHFPSRQQVHRLQREEGLLVESSSRHRPLGSLSARARPSFDSPCFVLWKGRAWEHARGFPPFNIGASLSSWAGRGSAEAEKDAPDDAGLQAEEQNEPGREEGADEGGVLQRASERKGGVEDTLEPPSQVSQPASKTHELHH